MKSSLLIWIFATMWVVIENSHYGWNVPARSDAEMICDGIAFILFALAVHAHAVEGSKSSVTITKLTPSEGRKSDG